MRILHVVATGQRRGAELFASDLVRSLGQKGVSQRVGVLHGSDGCRVPFDAPVSLLSSDGKRRVPGLGVDIRTAGALRSLVAGWKPDVIQTHGGEALKHALLAGGGFRARIVYRRIGIAPPWITHGPRRVAHSVLMRRPARIVAVAEAIRRETLDLFRVPSSRVVTIPNAVDARRMEWSKGREETRRALGIPLEAPVVLSLGALTWEKDPIAHVEVAARILRLMPEAIHVFVGEGPLRRDVETRIERLSLDGHVRLLGTRDDVADLMAASDVALLASAVEGMPATAIEAGMVGVPVVAHAIAGVPEVVIDGVTGCLSSPGDLVGLSQSVLDLVGDEEARRAMGSAARERCLALFDIRSIAPRYLEVYESLVPS